LPALGSVGGVVDHDQCLYQAAHDERVHGDDRKPGDCREPSWTMSVTSVCRNSSGKLPEK
jgi:hypothetical protein